MNIRFKGYLVFLLALLGFTLKAQEPTKGLFYEISGKGLTKPSFLFGTFHILKSGYFDEHPIITSSFEKVDNLVVEVELTPGALADVQDAMLMPDIAISDYLSADEVDKIDRELIRSTGTGIDFYDHIKPSAILTTLTTSMPIRSKEKFSMFEGEVMDTYLMEEARDYGKPIISLETVEDQIDVLLGDPIELQIAQLKDFLNVDKDDSGISGQVVDLYFAEDLPGLYKMALDNPDQIGSFDRMLTKRNNNWMKKLPDLLKEGSCFIAVGALHLAGPVGLVYQLRKAGYTVKPIGISGGK